MFPAQFCPGKPIVFGDHYLLEPRTCLVGYDTSEMVANASNPFVSPSQDRNYIGGREGSHKVAEVAWSAILRRQNTRRQRVVGMRVKPVSCVYSIIELPHRQPIRV